MTLVQGRRSQSYEPLLLENEREAVADLLQYLESEILLFFQSELPSRCASQIEPPPISFRGHRCPL
jgi:hypothetical protein